MTGARRTLWAAVTSALVIAVVCGVSAGIVSYSNRSQGVTKREPLIVESLGFGEDLPQPGYWWISAEYLHPMGVDDFRLQSIEFAVFGDMRIVRVWVIDDGLPPYKHGIAGDTDSAKLPAAWLTLPRQPVDGAVLKASHRYTVLVEMYSSRTARIGGIRGFRVQYDGGEWAGGLWPVSAIWQCGFGIRDPKQVCPALGSHVLAGAGPAYVWTRAS